MSNKVILKMAATDTSRAEGRGEEGEEDERRLALAWRSGWQLVKTHKDGLDLPD